MDPETRIKVAEKIKESCPLRGVLRPGKACPFFGPSATCRDCTYDWVTIAVDVGKLVQARRASYEQEKQKVKGLVAELESVKPLAEKMVECFRILSVLATEDDESKVDELTGEK